jgi:hypothetical protein
VASERIIPTAELDRLVAERSAANQKVAIARVALTFIAELDGTAGVVARTALEEMERTRG